MAIWNPRANEIFASVVEVPLPQRQVALEQACGLDGELRRQVEALLAAHARAGSFLDRPAPGAIHLDAPDLPATGPDSGPPLPAGGSIIRALGVASRVHLRDPEGEALTPVARPNSDNMPEELDLSGRLQLHGEIARGGMGAILKGRDIDLGRDVAIKVLLETHQGKTELVQRFVEEAQISGQLQHPGITPVYELGQFADKRPYFTMKLVKGKTLAALLQARKDAAEERSKFVGIFAQVCQTLAYAHARGVIHRDLKPSNVMVGAFGEVQVMDWGLAKVLANGGVADEEKAQQHQTVSVIRTQRSAGSGTPEFGSHTQAGSVLGTPAYMAPEQARGDVELIDERADVFGLGAVLCEILTGQPPYAGKKAEVQRKAQTASLDDAHARLDGCGADAELIGLARRCLAAEPWDRPRDAGQVAEAVAAYQNAVAERLHQAELAHAAEVARAEEARATAAAAEAKARAERRSRRLTLALAASVLLTGVLGAAGWRWVELERIGRAAARDARVNAALQEAVRLRGLAQGAALGDLAPWTEAVAAARKAEALLEPGVDPALRQQSEALLAEVSAEQQQAEEAIRTAERDRGLLDRLIDIRSAKGDDLGGRATDAAYAQAFREVGLDVVALPPAEVGAQLRARPAAVALALATALDDWAAVRRDKRKDTDGAKRLTEAARVVDPDRWRREFRAAVEQPDKEARLTALRALAGTARFDELDAVSLDLLGNALNDAGDAAAAERVLREAQQRHPGDVWVNYDLAQVLEKLSRREEAIRYYMAARALRPETAHHLAHSLEWKGERDEAIAVFQDLVRLRPKSARHLSCLGSLLQARGRAEEAGTVLDAAVAVSREAAQLHPEDPLAHSTLGHALLSQKQYDAAIASFREAIRLQLPDLAKGSLYNIGFAQFHQGRLDEAIAAWRKVIELQADLAWAHTFLGMALGLQGKHEEAIAACREGVRIQPDNEWTHNRLGSALARQRKLDEAITEYHEAIRLMSDYASAHCNLGLALRRKGQYAEALASFQRGHDLSSKQPDPEHPSGELLREAEQIVALAPKLPALLKGQTQPTNASERFALAQICADREWYVAAVRFWSEAFAEDPQRADDLQIQYLFEVQSRYRYAAASAAALAGAGKARDDPPPDDTTKAKLRQQARTWLQADLAAYAKRLDSEDPKAPGLARRRLVPWKYDPQLAGIRDEAALAKLPAAEQEECQKLWAEVEALLRKAESKQ